MTVKTVRIGESELQTLPIGVGTWAWGDTRMWEYGKAYNAGDVAAAFKASVQAGLTLFDSAEIYGRGESERLLGMLVRESGAHVLIATKFWPLALRFRRASVMQAVDASLARLGAKQIDLYQVHWPYSLIPFPELMDGLADAVQAGKVRAVGVSNYSASLMRRAYDLLAGRGVPLVANQVEYSLLHRQPEANGVLPACRELNVALIAYSPLAKGILTGKYRPGSRITGLRRFTGAFRRSELQKAEPVIELMTQIGQAHGGKAPAQVALNWLIRQPGVIAIPGAKTAHQAEINAGALGWQMTDAEADGLSRATLC